MIHKATVKTVNAGRSSVSVEWFEGGAIKGKEVSGGYQPEPGEGSWVAPRTDGGRLWGGGCELGGRPGEPGLRLACPGAGSASAPLGDLGDG